MKDIPKNAITERDLRKKARSVIEDKYNSAGDWAKTHDITAQAISAFLTKRQGPGRAIPRALGYEPVTIYVPVPRKKAVSK